MAITGTHSVERNEGLRALDVTAFVLTIIGGLNWLLWGLFEFDLVAMIFGGGERTPSDDVLARVIYCLVGLSALYLAVAIGPILRRWRHHAPSSPSMG